MLKRKNNIFLSGLFIFFTLFFASCEKNDDTIESPAVSANSVITITNFENRIKIDSARLNKVGSDTINIKFYPVISSATEIQTVYYIVKYHDDFQIAFSGTVNASKSGSNYSFPVAFTIANTQLGSYQLEFYAVDKNNNPTNNIVSDFQIYKYGNHAPIILSLIADSVITVTNEKETYYFILNVDDEDGLNDIESVYFNTTKPNGNPSSGNPFSMENKGNGVYSFSFPIDPNFPASDKGVYTYAFQVRDKIGFKSEILTHKILIK